MKKILFRVLLIGYPILAVCLFLLLFYGRYREVALLQAELDELRQSDTFQENTRQLLEMRRRQRREIARWLRQFQARAGHYDRPTLTGQVAGAAHDAGIAVQRVGVKEVLNRNGWSFLVLDILGEGPFESLMELLVGLEEKDSSFVATRRLMVDNSERAGVLELECEAIFLVGVPWDEQDLAILEKKQDEPQTEPSAETTPQEGADG